MDPDVKKKMLDLSVTEDEFLEISTIFSRKNVADEARNKTSFPEGTDTAVISSYFRAANDGFADARVLEDRWWGTVTKKYKLPSQTYLDVSSGEFYTLEK